jgi:hypothetical protein
MTTPAVILLLLVAAAVLFAVAWWSSGRVRGRAPSASVRAAGQTEAMKHYRPGGGTPPNLGGG